MSVERDTIHRFVAGHVHGVPFDDSTDLFAGGLVNSLFAVQIVMWVERTFPVEVRGEDLDMRNFHSVDAITRFVRRRAVSP
ncbi:phosphopantetheine-binding protein [Actinophytocola sp.]|uniref:phosphopantetheine-binding protein n=1 Tax=Actinophytocola sp. TaxID=1872138 RepID=UPI00389A472A